MAEEKLKILYLMQMLLEETDPAHPMNATQLCERMQSRSSVRGCSPAMNTPITGKRSTRISNACKRMG